MAALLNRADAGQVRDFTHRAIKSALHDALFCPLTLGEKHDIRVKPKFETACWSYLPPHRIYVGTGIVDKAKLTLSPAQLSGYVKSHVRHELAHAHWTERNMRKVRQALKEIDAPFQLFNLFEDARIEDRYRRDADYAFEWLTYEDLDYSRRPESMLFGLIQAEGNIKRVKKFVAEVDIAAEREQQKAKLTKRQEESKNPLELFALFQMAEAQEMGPEIPAEVEKALGLNLLERVAGYYQRMIASSDTAGMYPILTDWMKEFGKTQTAPSRGCAGRPGDKSDLEIGAELQEDDAALADFDADAEQVKAGDGDGKGGAKGKAKADDEDAIGRKGVVLSPDSKMPDLERADRLAAKFKKFFEAEVRTVATTTPQRRISPRHFAIGRPYYRVKQLQGKARKKLLLEFDCSGSMAGTHLEEGKVLLAALSRLARQGYVEGHVLLSAGRPSRWELYELPMADHLIARIQAFAGAEGLEPTLKDNLVLARDADYVFIYTDGQITDKAIDKAALHRYGVFTWGLYAGERDEFLEGMQMYFDKAILRDSAEALVDAMLTQKK